MNLKHGKKNSKKSNKKNLMPIHVYTYKPPKEMNKQTSYLNVDNDKSNEKHQETSLYNSHYISPRNSQPSISSISPRFRKERSNSIQNHIPQKKEDIPFIDSNNSSQTLSARKYQQQPIYHTITDVLPQFTLTGSIISPHHIKQNEKKKKPSTNNIHSYSRSYSSSLPPSHPLPPSITSSTNVNPNPYPLPPLTPSLNNPNLSPPKPENNNTIIPRPISPISITYDSHLSRSPNQSQFPLSPSISSSLPLPYEEEIDAETIPWLRKTELIPETNIDEWDNNIDIDFFCYGLPAKNSIGQGSNSISHNLNKNSSQQPSISKNLSNPLPSSHFSVQTFEDQDNLFDLFVQSKIDMR